MSIPDVTSYKILYSTCLYCRDAGHKWIGETHEDSEGVCGIIIDPTSGVSASATVNGVSYSKYVGKAHSVTNYSSTTPFMFIPVYSHTMVDVLAISNSSPSGYPTSSNGTITLTHVWNAESLSEKYPDKGLEGLTVNGWIKSSGGFVNGTDLVFDKMEFVEGNSIDISGDMLMPVGATTLYMIYPVLVAPRMLPDPEPDPDTPTKSGVLRFVGDSGMLCFNSNGNLVYY